MRCFALLLISTVLAGCAPAPMTEARISDRFTPAEAEQVIEGVLMWCEAGVTCLDVSIVPDDQANILPAEPPAERPGAEGSHQDGVIEIYVENHRVADRTVVLTVAHEVGHALSTRSGHPDCQNCLMSAGSHHAAVSGADVDWVTGE